MGVKDRFRNRGSPWRCHLDTPLLSTAEYDMLNREVRRTDALGNETVTGYDPLGRTVSTSGDAYPILSGFDSAGRKTHGFTTRDGGATWDETQWEFDPASGVNTAKEYADGSRVAYSYTDNGKKTRTTWARGVWKQHAYNVRNLVSGTTYSGTATPSVAYTYADSGKTAGALRRLSSSRQLLRGEAGDEGEKSKFLRRHRLLYIG